MGSTVPIQQKIQLLNEIDILFNSRQFNYLVEIIYLINLIKVVTGVKTAEYQGQVNLAFEVGIFFK